MKLYLENIQDINMKKLIDYKTSTTKEVKLYSPDGIFVIDKNNYKKELINEGESTKITYDKTNLVTDTSTLYYENENKIPYEHIQVEYTKQMYYLRQKAIVGLCVVYSNGCIVDAYFESKKYNENDYALKEEVLSFIKLIN